MIFYKLPRKRINVINLVSLFLIALQFDLFYLISTEFKLGQGILAVVSAFIIFKYIKLIGKSRDINNYLFIYLFILLITGAYQVTRLFGGSFFSAFLAERVLWVYILFYIALKKLFLKGVMYNERCIKLLKYAGIIQLVLYYTQWLLSNRIIFLHVLTGERYGALRFYFQPILLILLLCFCVSDFFNNKEERKNLIWIILIISEILLVQKYRMTTVAIGASLLCGFFLYRGKVDRGIAIFIVVVLASIILINTQIGRDIILSLLDQGTDNSIKGRAAWRIWALGQLKDRPLLGNGFVYTAETFKYGGQYVHKHFSWSFTPSDHGIMGFIYEYGLLGAGWFLLFVVSQFKRAFYVWKYNRNYAYIIFLFFIVIDSYSELYWIMNNGLFALVIYMVMLHSEYKSIVMRQKGQTHLKDDDEKFKSNIESQNKNLEYGENRKISRKLRLYGS